MLADVLERAGVRYAVQGLSGLIVLGDAWDSADMRFALSVALDSAGHAGPALLWPVAGWAGWRWRRRRQRGR